MMDIVTQIVLRKHVSVDLGVLVHSVDTVKTTERFPNPATSGAKFIGSSLPTTIKCHLGDPCEIPSVLTGDPNVKPSMKKGFVDSSIEVQNMNVTQDKNSSHVYHTVTSILPKKTGNHKVCVQNVNSAGQTADELCYSIEVTAGKINVSDLLMIIMI
ncbi:Hypothetical predicted protein [Mytilus galloprovincialis]|uniref:Uncharacterized protein n=1 Tax=Mytilus galloprovincialis TaxID=29158 RepID=A0A8B6EIG6_MYTGA|nr:Hypothetical predicted protein [Mytilus galloprovincialis]